MKFTLLLLFCSLFQLKAEVFSQRKVSVQMSEVTLDRVFQELGRQAKCDFLYNHSLVKQKGNVTISVEDRELNAVLDELLPRLGMEYVLDENVIIIREKWALPQNQDVEVRGTVRDEKGTSLPGVTVVIKGTTLGTATDDEGEFVLRLPRQEGITLVFSYVGMKLEEVKFTGQKDMQVVLYADEQEMEEVVVTGYQVLDKRTLTSSISTVRADELEKMGVLTVDQMLEGKAPGLLITNISAQPGAAPKVRVRSAGTFTGTREPLWVVDGIIYEDPVPLSAAEINSYDNVNLIGNAITGLNPQDIESINILKDASATAIYGTRAANGVIVITTRRGKSGTPVVSYSGSVNAVIRPHYSDFNLMNSKERVDVSREIYERGLGYPQNNNLYTPLGYEKALLDYWKHGNFSAFQKEVGRLERLNYDWFDELYCAAVNHSHSVNISGGSDQVRYYFSVGYDNQRGTEKGVSLDRVTSRANLDVDLRKNLLLSFGMDGSVQKAKYNHSSIQVFDEAYNRSRAVEARDENGELVYIDKRLSSDRQELGRYNILNEMQNSARKIDNKAYNFNVTLNWELVKGIKLSSRFAYRNTTNITEEWIKDNTFFMAQLRSYDEFRDDIAKEDLQQYSLVPFGGIFSGSQTTQESFSVRNQLNLLKIINEKHVFNLNITQEASSTKYKGVTGWQSPGYNHDGGRKFIPLPALSQYGNFDLSDYTYQAVLKWFTEGGANGYSVYPTVTDNLKNMLSWTGIFTYSYDDRYIANFNIRSDGSNTFGQYERYKFKPSWSASVRWNIHKENFLNPAEKINELALRGSYGFRGTSPATSPYLTLKNYGRNDAVYMPENTSELAEFPNANLKWEKTATVNAGIDFAFWGNRLSGAIDYAYSKSTDLLLQRPVSLVNGSSMQWYNGGSKEDYSLELNLRGEIIRTKDFGWNMNFNLSREKENILEGTNVIPGQISIDDYLNGQILMADFPIDGFFAYKFDKLDEEGYPTFPELFGTYDSEYEKLQKALVYVGSRQPKFYGGFGTELSWKGLTLSANFSYKAGQHVRLLNLYRNGQQMPLSGDNMRNEFVDRWRNPGDEERTNIPVLSTDPKEVSYATIGSDFIPGGKNSTSLWELYNYSNIRTAKGDFIRWQSLTLSWRCPQQFLKNIGVRSAVLRFQMQNLAVWTFDKKLKGQDPEQVESLGLPVQPSYNVGLMISF